MNSIRIRNPSLEFNWLPNSIRKGIKTPRLFLLSDDRYGGFYAHQSKVRCIHSDLDVDLLEGPVIALCQSQNAGILAHEYRHHLQVSSGCKISGSVWETQTYESYRGSIVRYFTSYWWEMDALLFQLKHAPDDVSLQWKEWLINS